MSEIDERLVEFFQQELIEVIDGGAFDRIVEIIRFVPQEIRVENTYEYGCSKQKVANLESQLRTTIVELLKEIEENDEIDLEVIGRARAAVGLGVIPEFRRRSKVVEVEKVIEKVVERIVEVPQVVPVEKVIEKVIEVPRIQ